MANESPARVIVDQDGNVVLITTEGTYSLAVQDDKQEQLLQGILEELQTIKAILAGMAG